MNIVKRVLFVMFPVFFPVLLLVNCSGNDVGRITAPGVVDGDIITLKAVVSGSLKELDLKEGAPVVKDGVLARIDTAKVENQLSELDINARDIDINVQSISRKLQFLNANIRYLREQVERFRRLKEKNALPGEKLESMELKLMEADTSRFELNKSLDSLQVQREKIQNKQEYLRLLLEDHVIKAPVTGVVMETFVSEGESVFPGTAIADILDTSSLYVEIFIEEKELAGLQLNQDVEIHVDGRAEPLHGVVSHFGKKAEFSPKYIISEKERQSLLYQVKVKIDNIDGYLKIGMPVTVVIDHAGKKE